MQKLTKYLLVLGLLIFPIHSFAYPILEKTPATGSAPLSILGSQPTNIFVPTTGDFQNKFMFTFQGSTVTVIDLETWDTFTTQPDPFISSVVDAALLDNGTSLIVALSDGNVARLELDDLDTFEDTEVEDPEDENAIELDSRQIDIADDMTDPGISFMVADPNQSRVFMVNDSGFFFEYNFATNQLVNQFDLSTDTGTEVTTFTPTDMVFADSDSGDKILISTTTGEILIVDVISDTVSTVDLVSTAVTNTDPNFAEMAVTPDGDFAFVIDSDNDVIWVFDILTEAFIDQKIGETNLDPIEVEPTQNSDFSNIMIYEDDLGSIVAYVSGLNGLTLIDAEDPISVSSDSKVIDVDTGNADADDPIPLSGVPGPLAKSSTDLGYIFSANGNAEISVLTDNPWITISNIDPETVTEAASTFTLTFQSDATGTYIVKANSDPTSAEGTVLIGTTPIDTADSDITTDSIDINSFSRTTFSEGENKIFVFATDASGLLGHTAVLLNVDRPPEAITITAVNFGNKKVFINFETSPDPDISEYQLFAEPATNQDSPVCPDTLTFTSADTITGTVTAADCSDTICEAGLSTLNNGTAYCIAVSVIDLAGQESPLAYFSTAVIPQQTVGPAGFLGEVSCSLHPSKQHIQDLRIYFLIFSFLIPIIFVRKIHKKFLPRFFIFLLLSLFMFPSVSNAEERTPQNWTLEFKTYMWFPTDSPTRDFLGTCCHFGGEVEFGWLYKNRYNITLSTGLGYDRGAAVGILSGEKSGDHYNLFMFPVRLDFVYRFDYKSEQFLLPYLRTGFDTVIFHESTGGDTITNVKFGLHGAAGLGILLDRIEAIGNSLEADAGVNDVYLIIEARYAYINSFKSSGLDFSGFYPYLGVLFEF